MFETANKGKVQQGSAIKIFRVVMLSMGVGCGGDPNPGPSTATAPTIVSQPPLHAVVGDFWAYDVMGEDPEGGPFTLERTRGPEGSRVVAGTLRVEWTPNLAGNFDFEVSLADPTGLRTTQSFTVVVAPHAMNWAAPPLDPAKPYVFDEAYSFLFEGENAPQQGVQLGAIKKEFMALIHGRVVGRDGSAIEGVRASVKYHPELGMTRTSSTGVFRFVVNGGGRYVVQLEKTPEYFRVEREIKTEYHTHKHLEQVVLVPPSAMMTPLQLGTGAMQFARGPIEEDADGRRQATVLFPSGTSAQAKMRDGTMVPITTLSIRATEFTVGGSGPKAMPADLPAASGYTYAVNFSADEAMAMGAESVVFSQPVPFYVDNFLGFPVGSIVPIGSYDDESSRWKAEPDGRVIAVLGSDNGVALLDTNGDGAADDSATLSALNVSSDELRQLATLYSSGTTLWRSSVEHWSTFDCNWPFGPPLDATGPPEDLPEPLAEASNHCDESGSIIECDDGGLGEEVPVAGTPYRLVYRSRRMSGFASSRTLDIPLSGVTLPNNLGAVVIELEVAGRSYREVLTTAPNLVYHFVWDGRDAFGREVYGRAVVTGRVGYSYRPVYYSPGLNFGPGFSRSSSNITIEGGTRNSVSISDVQAILWRTLPQRTLQRSVPISGFGGWTLSPEHRLAEGGKIEMGDGRTLPAVSANQITLAAGAMKFGDPKAIPGHASVYGQITGIAALPDGRFIVHVCDGAVPYLYSIREGEAPEELLSGYEKVTLADGRELDFAVGLNAGQFCETVQTKSRLKVDRESRVVMNFSGYLLRFDPSQHTFDRLAGTGLPFDNQLYATKQVITATASALPYNAGLAVGPSDEITISSSQSIFDLVDGRLIPRAGFPPDCSTLGSPEEVTRCRESEADGHNGRPAIEAAFRLIHDIDYGPDGTLYIVDGTAAIDVPGTDQLRSIRADGVVRLEAGIPRSTPSPSQFWDSEYEPLSATDVPLDGSLDGVAVSPDGIVYLSHQPGYPPNNYSTSLIHTFQPGSTLRWEIGTYGDLFELVPGADTTIHGVGGGFREVPRGFCSVLTFDPRGDLLFTAGQNHAGILRAQVHSVLGNSTTIVASPDRFSRFYFDRYGRIQQERSAPTAVVEREFRRDSAGYLSEIEEQSGDITRMVERTADSLVIVAPYGQRTELSFDEHGYLKEVRDPIGRTHKMRYDDGGLLRFFTNPKDQTTEYVIDQEGRVKEVRWPNGGTKTLAFESSPGRRSSTYSSAENRQTIFEARVSNDVQIRSARDANGLGGSSERTSERISVALKNGVNLTVHTRGPTGGEGLGPMVDGVRIALPSGRALEGSSKRTVVQAENAIADGLPVDRLTYELSTGSRTTTISYVHLDRTITVTTPAGRNYSSRLDEKGHVVELHRPGVEPVHVRYDSRGRVEFVAQATRTATLTYDALGHLERVINPRSETIGFIIDRVGQLKTQTAPDQQTTGFEYDPNGHLSALTPPSRPAHAFRVKETENRLEYELRLQRREKESIPPSRRPIATAFGPRLHFRAEMLRQSCAMRPAALKCCRRRKAFCPSSIIPRTTNSSR